MKKSTVIKILNNPSRVIKSLGSKGYLKWMSDDLYLKLIYKAETRLHLDLEKPKNFNEKIQWLKINSRVMEYTDYVDKFEVRQYIKSVIGEQYLVPILGVYDNVDEIDWEKLPDKFVMKCTHGSSSNIICTNKKELNIKKIKKTISKWQKTNWYWYGREWPYKNVKPRIICEGFLEQNDGKELRDYRFFCFNGEPKFITVDFSITDKEKTRRNLYDLNWDLMDEEISYPKELEFIVEKPDKLNKMIEICKKLSKNIPHVRIDFYYIDENILFGEMTLFHQSGLGNITPQEFNEKMGEWIELPID